MGRPISVAELVAARHTGWAVLRDGLARWTPGQMAGIITREDAGETETFSRAWIVWHLIEHDLHHGGEISLTLGMHGLAAPDI